MAFYGYNGISISLFSAYFGAGSLANTLLYLDPTEFGYTNADGSKTYVTGSGFVWDSATNTLTGAR
jgi:hypothetical protein